jgi:glycosyltransferase involved in cell wall biosynthesis
VTDRIVGVSEDAAALCRADDRHSADRIVALWNGIDVDRFDFRGPAAAPIAISVARLSPEKDFSTLLRAVWILIKEHPEFLGERSDVAQLLPQAGFFVSSSLTEGISLTILEAMAVGLLVVTTRVGGNPEIVVDGGTGRLVDSGSPEQLALAMRDMLNDTDTWPIMSQLARQRIERDFNVRNMVRGYEEIYTELLREKGVS